MPKILVVEEEPAFRTLLSLALSDEGYDVAVAASGAAALELLAAHPVDLVLCDFHLPVMDGAQLVRRYREMAQPHAPVIMMTATGDPAPPELLAVADLLRKPFDLERMIAMIERRLAP